MAEHIIANIKALLQSFKVSTTLKDSILFIKSHPKNTTFSPELKTCIYFLLNKLENRYFIVLDGFPYCFLPDARDHISKKPAAVNDSRKNPACKSCAFNNVCSWKDSKLKHFTPNPISDAPIEIAIELNKNCNLQCSFCFQAERKNNQHLPYSRLKHLFTEAKELGIHNIRFTGGEPLLHKDIIKILREAKKKEFNVSLNTNGTLLSENLITSIEKNVDDILISLPSYSQTMENRINKKGTLLPMKLMNVVRLKRSKIPHLRIGTIISKEFLNNFSKYANLINILDITTWELYRPMISANQLRSCEELNLNKTDYQKLFGLMGKFKRMNSCDIYIANALPFCITKNKRQFHLMRGAQYDDGNLRLVLDVKGYLKPSYSLDINLGTSIKEAQRHPLMQKMRSGKYLSSYCKQCAYLRWCRGGSRYLAGEYFHDYFQSDPILEYAR